MALEGYPCRVVDFGINRKRVCDFLLIINSIVGPSFTRFRDIAGFLLRRATQLLFHPNFGGVLLELDCRYCGPRSEDPKIIIRVISFEVTQHTSTIHQRHSHTNGRVDGQTYRLTDGRLTVAIPRFALRATRGNKTK